MIFKQLENDKHLLAYYVLAGDHPETIEFSMLKAFLGERLPDYMIPSAFIPLDAIPLTPSGKVDRKGPAHRAVQLQSTQAYVAPRNANEEILAEIWQDILGVNRVGIHDNFFELGGHSLLATRLLSRLQRIYHLNFSLAPLFEFPTIASFIEAMEKDRLVLNTLVYLEEEAQLATSISIDNVDPPEQCHKSILLTGCTGFVGRFLLVELLEQTTATVYCLMRGTTAGECFIRLKKILKDNGLWQSTFVDRIHIVKGDIAQPLLGLTVMEFDRLAEIIDTIYHNATFMNHLASYKALKSANVGGMQEMFRFACTKKLKQVNYVSTTDIFSERDQSLRREVDEFTCIDHEHHFAADGYTSSKWVADKLAMLAQNQGIPCRIYRLGLVSGDTKQGRYDPAQWFYSFVTSCLQLGAYPIDSPLELSILPVDFVARSIISLATQAMQEHPVFHLHHPDKVQIIRWFEVLNASEQFSQRLQPISYYQWLQKVERVAQQSHELPIYPIVYQHLHLDEHALQERLDQNHSTLRVLSQYTIEQLQKSGIRLPEIDEALISLYLDFMISKTKEIASAVMPKVQ